MHQIDPPRAFGDGQPAGFRMNLADSQHNVMVIAVIF